jgi:uncharacterized membrane protein
MGTGDDVDSVPRVAVPVGMVLTAALIVVAGWMFKAHCYADGGWQGGEQYTTGCYTDVVPFWTGRDVSTGAVPYVDTGLEYPVLTGAQIWFEGAVARALVGPTGSAFVFLAVVTLVNGALALGILAVLARIGVPHRRLWWWVLAPPLVLYVGHNWDLLAMFLLMVAVAQHQRGRALGSGIAIGLGTAAKLFPGLALPVFVLAHLRRGAVADVTRLVGGAAGAWLVVNVPVAIVAFDRWAEFYTFSSERLGTFAATWTVAAELDLLSTSVAQRNLWGAVAFALGAVAIVAIGWRRHAGHEWVLLTPLIAWFLLTNKVYSPQFDLWLLPLLVATSRRTWPLAAFVATDALVYLTEFWYLGLRAGYSPSAPYGALAVAASLRAVVLICVVVLAVRDRAPAWTTPPRPSPAVDEATAVGADSR